jgi:sodium-dependent phosphate transporter
VIDPKNFINMVAASMEPYLWIVVLGGITGFAYAFGIGANDVANAFASTVASKSLTLAQAVLVASIFEFGGAFFLGAQVTGTIRSKIFDTKLYVDQPDIVLLGMFTSLVTSTLMLMVATYNALPVSTTHTIVGAIMGFSIAAKGFSSINSDVASQIFISWILSPVVSGALSFIFFGSIRYFILSSEDSYNRAYYAFPLILTIFVGIDLFYILYKGTSNLEFNDQLSLSWVLPASFGVGAFCGAIWLVVLGPIARRRVGEKFARDAAEAEYNAAVIKEAEDEANDKKNKEETVAAAAGSDEDGDNDLEMCSDDHLPAKNNHDANTVMEDSEHEPSDPPQDIPDEPSKMGFKEKMGSMHASFAARTYGQDLHEQSMRESKVTEEMWEHAKHFDAPSEQMFTYVQVFTACLNSFAHGANDISNAIAPISAIFLIYETGELNSKAPVQKWVLAYGGVGLILGLLIYGYKVMKSLGYKLTALSPSRGASAELAASLFVVTASYMEIPVSSTQCIVGAIAGVGLTSGFKSVGWLFFFKVCMGWVLIFFTAVAVSMGLFCFLAFSPSLTQTT